MNEDIAVTLARMHSLLTMQGEDIREIKADVKSQNGRVNAHETRITVLEDRGTQAKDGHARYAGWGGVVIAAGTWVWQLLHK